MKDEVLRMMLQNKSILEISQGLQISFDTIRKFQTEIIFDKSKPKTVASTLDNIRLMEARAFEIAENYSVSNSFELNNLITNLENARV